MQQVAVPNPVEVIDRQRWLDAIAEPLQDAIGTGFASAGPAGIAIRDFLHGVWLKHPLHPAITDVPIGAWTAAQVLDVADIASGTDAFADAVDATILVGLIGSAGAAATGFADWHHVRNDKPRRVGLVHALLNAGVAMLYVLSLVSRRSGARGLGRVLSAIGYSISMASAWLGGELVSDLRIGVNHADGALPEKYTPVLDADDLAEGQMRRVEVNGTGILIARQDGLHALADSCAHLGCSLAEGRLGDGEVQCPCHGSRFALDNGRVLEGPATFPQPKLDTRLRVGKIEVRAPKS